MTSEDFVTRLRAVVIEENTEIYRDLFANTSIDKVSDPYWKRALTLFNALSPAQQEIFFEVVRQVAVDTASNILGVIDGGSSIEGVDVALVLTCDGENHPLNGDLQSLFLAEEEKIHPEAGEIG